MLYLVRLFFVLYATQVFVSYLYFLGLGATGRRDINANLFVRWVLMSILSVLPVIGVLVQIVVTGGQNGGYYAKTLKHGRDLFLVRFSNVWSACQRYMVWANSQPDLPIVTTGRRDKEIQ